MQEVLVIRPSQVSSSPRKHGATQQQPKWPAQALSAATGQKTHDRGQCSAEILQSVGDEKTRGSATKGGSGDQMQNEDRSSQDDQFAGHETGPNRP